MNCQPEPGCLQLATRKGELMLGESKAIVFLATTQPEAARQFYEAVLGLRFIADEHFALVFDIDGRMLRISKVQALVPAKHTVLGWDVQNIAAVVDQLAGRGITFEHFEGMPQNARGIWQSPTGAQVAWFKDPDGNMLSLTQFGFSEAATTVVLSQSSGFG